jgi:hypothetical protein
MIKVTLLGQDVLEVIFVVGILLSKLVENGLGGTAQDDVRAVRRDGSGVSDVVGDDRSMPVIALDGLDLVNGLPLRG